MVSTAILVSLASLSGLAQGYPSLLTALDSSSLIKLASITERQEPLDHSWQFRGFDGQGVRSPCPGLNTLANHGYINRDGFGITAQQVQQGFLDAFNIAFDVTSAGASNAINVCTFVTGRNDCTSFDLWMLDTPHQIEHDASLSRADFDMPYNHKNDNYRLNMVFWQSTLIIWGGATHIGITQASSAIQGRRAQQRALDTPGWYMDSDGSFFELAFVLTSMNDPVINPDQDIDRAQARLDWVDYWIENDRLPTDLGWVKPSQAISQPYILAIANSIAVAPTAPPAPGTFYASPNSPATADKRDISHAAATATSMPSASAIKSDTVGLLQGTEGGSTAQMRLVEASAQAGPAPTAYNPYVDRVTVQKMAEQKEAFSQYEAGFCNAMHSLIADVNA